MLGVAVAALASVDHQHAPAGARQLRCGRQAGVAAADNDHVKFIDAHAVLPCDVY